MVYQDYIEDKIDLLIDRICCIYPDLEDKRWYALKYLEKDKSVINSHPLEFEDIIDRDYEKDIINQKYNFIEEIVDEVLVNKKRTKPAQTILTAISPANGLVCRFFLPSWLWYFS